MLSLFLIPLCIYGAGVLLFTLMYASWFGLSMLNLEILGECIGASLRWPVDLAERWFGGR